MTTEKTSKFSFELAINSGTTGIKIRGNGAVPTTLSTAIFSDIGTSSASGVAKRSKIEIVKRYGQKCLVWLSTLRKSLKSVSLDTDIIPRYPLLA